MPSAINLVPEVQQVKQSDDRKKKLAFSLIVLINGGLIALIVVLFLVSQGQRFALNRMQNDINTKHEKFVATENVKDIVSLQRNLKALPGLYQSRVLYTRFLDLFEDVAPASVVIATMSSSQDGVIEATGTAPDYRLVSKLAEAMRAKAEGKFENIEIKSANSEGGSVTFAITALASPDITAVGGGQ